VTNRDDRFHDLRVAFHYDFHLAARGHEAAARDAATGGVVHHGGRRALLLNAIGPDGAGVPLVTIGGARGGSDSLLGIPIPLAPGESAMVTTWIAAARTVPEARRVDAEARRVGVPGLLGRTRGFWTAWASTGAREDGDLPEEARDLYAHGLLMLRLLQSPSGALLSAVEETAERSETPGTHDTPGTPDTEQRWCRLRDAAPAADALGRAGYAGAARRYFEFTAASARASGELAAVLDAEGAPAPAPEHALRSVEGIAVHLWAAARHFERERDAEFIAPIYEDSLAPAAERLAASADPALGLPISADFWDERLGVHASVAAAVRGGLRAASRLAAFFGETARARAWTLAADQAARSTTRSLYDAERGRFLRSIIANSGANSGADSGGSRADTTLDASLLRLGLLDDLEPEDPRVRSTVAAVRAALWVRAGGGLARHESDAAGPGMETGHLGPGGPGGLASVTATLWLAQHAIRSARKLQDLEGARVLLLWTAARAEGVGLLPERVGAAGSGAGAPEGAIGPSPSLAATAAYVTTVLDYRERARLLLRCDRCGEPAPARRARRAAERNGASLPGIVAHL
jgi:GH15 family glucan-1,4-alpha-glucosidase